jgi:hypothetical protein
MDIFVEFFDALKQSMLHHFTSVLMPSFLDSWEYRLLAEEVAQVPLTDTLDSQRASELALSLVQRQSVQRFLRRCSGSHALPAQLIIHRKETETPMAPATARMTEPKIDLGISFKQVIQGQPGCDENVHDLVICAGDAQEEPHPSSKNAMSPRPMTTPSVVQSDHHEFEKALQAINVVTEVDMIYSLPGEQKQAALSNASPRERGVAEMLRPFLVPDSKARRLVLSHQRPRDRLITFACKVKHDDPPVCTGSASSKYLFCSSYITYVPVKLQKAWSAQAMAKPRQRIELRTRESDDDDDDDDYDDDDCDGSGDDKSEGASLAPSSSSLSPMPHSPSISPSPSEGADETHPSPEPLVKSPEDLPSASLVSSIDTYNLTSTSWKMADIRRSITAAREKVETELSSTVNQFRAHIQPASKRAGLVSESIGTDSNQTCGDTSIDKKSEQSIQYLGPESAGDRTRLRERWQEMQDLSTRSCFLGHHGDHAHARVPFAVEGPRNTWQDERVAECFAACGFAIASYTNELGFMRIVLGTAMQTFQQGHAANTWYPPQTAGETDDVGMDDAGTASLGLVEKLCKEYMIARSQPSALPLSPPTSPLIDQVLMTLCPNTVVTVFLAILLEQKVLFKGGAGHSALTAIAEFFRGAISPLE